MVNVTYEYAKFPASIIIVGLFELYSIVCDNYAVYMWRFNMCNTTHTHLHGYFWNRTLSDVTVM